MNRSLLATLIFTTLVGSAFALPGQEQIIIKKQIKSADSLRHKIILDHDVHVEIHDSIRHKIMVFGDGEFEFGDSVNAQVFVHRRPVIQEKLARIVVKKSGFFRKNKIVIDFDPRTRNIHKVVDNGNEVPEKKFHKYQEYLADATEFSELEALHPRMEELEYKLQLAELADSGVMAELENLVIDLEGLESEHARLKKKHYTSILHVIELEKLAEIIQGLFEEAGLTPPQKVKQVQIKDGKFFLNGNEVEGELGKKCIEAYQSHSGVQVDVDSDNNTWFDQDMDIQIIFD